MSDYAEMTVSDTKSDDSAEADQSPPHPTADGSSETPARGAARPETPEVARARREFAVLLGEFRRTPVLVPLDENADPLVGDYGGVRWIYAFSNETALARFAIARNEGSREWVYQRVLGARLLDAAVPAAGVPCGVALDVGSEDGDGVLFPPVAGIVPDAAAVDAGTANGESQYGESAYAESANGEEPR